MNTDIKKHLTFLLKGLRIWYIGECIGNVPNGYGVEYHQDCTKRYEGEWKNGRWHGHGREYSCYLGGILNEGKFINGTPKWRIDAKKKEDRLRCRRDKRREEKKIKELGAPTTKKLFLECGTLWYEGECIGDVPHGQGVKYRGDGTKFYEGEWRNGKLHGNGVVYWDNGRKLYEGQFKNGMENGDAVTYYVTGNKHYEGKFKDGKQHGHGIRYREDGTTEYEGKWKYGWTRNFVLETEPPNKRALKN